MIRARRRRQPTGDTALRKSACQRLSILALLLSASLLSWPSAPSLGHEGHEHGQDTAGKEPAAGEAVTLELRDAPLRDQDGRSLRFESEALGGRIVVMDFVYTSCTTVCPVLSQVMAQVMAQVRDGLGEELRRELRLISLSVDPARDTPARLKAQAARYGADPDWLWLTGDRPEMNKVLDGLGAYTPDFTEHPVMILVGDAQRGTWTRFYGFPDPAQILAKVEELAAARRQAERTSAAVPTPEELAEREAKARDYFTDLPVVTHDGRRLRFFTDLLKDKIVVVSLFFAECTEACPLVNAKLSQLQDGMKDILGREVFFVSVTLDPENDTPEVLKDYAARFEAAAGWSFVTGEPAQVGEITRKLGQVSKEISAHTTHLMIGDVKRAYWKKVPSNTPDDALIAFLRQLAREARVSGL